MGIVYGICLESVNVSGTCVNFGIVKIVPQDMALMRTQIEFGLWAGINIYPIPNGEYNKKHQTKPLTK